MDFSKIFDSVFGIPLPSLFRLASILALCNELNLTFLAGAFVWFFKITKAASFESAEMLRQILFLYLFYSIFSLTIFLGLYHPPLAALFMLWQSGSLFPLYLMLQRLLNKPDSI